MKPKTIITYLVNWNPQWIKTVELSNWIGKTLVIPRSQLKETKDRVEMKQPAIYFLFGKDEDDNDVAYIWEAENVYQRLLNHDTNKDFWNYVVVFVSKDNNLTKADVKFLEAKAINKAKLVNRYVLTNSVAPIPNNLPEYQESTMDEFLENIDLLISAIWFPILKEFVKNVQNKDEKEYFLTARGSDAHWLYTEEGFLVLKGSVGPVEMVKSEIENKQYAFRHRPKLLKKWVITEDWNMIRFEQDYLFNTPSSASNILLWSASNWWVAWKDVNGKTLDENERQGLE